MRLWYSKRSEEASDFTRMEPESLGSDDHYEQLFVQWSNRIERILRIAIITALSLLLFSQALLQWPLFRHAAVKVERLEGKPYKPSGHP